MFNPTSNTKHYLEENMMLEKFSWEGSDQGKGDALWRTSVAYIAYGDPILKTAILKCFRKFTMINRKKYWYQASRCYDRYREDDVSRDQVIMAMIALKFNDDLNELKEITDHLPKKISRRFKISFILQFWMKAVTTNSKWYTFLFHLFELVEFIPSVLINKMLRRLASRAQEYDPKWYLDVDITRCFWYESWDTGKPKWIWIEEPEKFPLINNGQKLTNNYKRRLKKNKFLKLIDTIMYPGYALHLTSWLTNATDHSKLKQLLQKFICWEGEHSNLLIRLLMDVPVTNVEIDDYQPLNNYRWSGRMDGSNEYKILNGDDVLYNALDKDLLVKLKEKY